MQDKGCSGVRIYVINPRAVRNKALNVWKAAKDLRFFIPKRVNGYTVGERVYMTVIPKKAVGKEYTSVREFRESFGEYEAPKGLALVNMVQVLRGRSRKTNPGAAPTNSGYVVTTCLYD